MDHNQLFNFILIYLIDIVLSNKTDVNCTLLLDDFAKSTSEFVQCAVYNSRPIRMCENCVDQYINVSNSYHNMTRSSDENGVCINNFINMDRLQIVLTLYNNNFDLWTRAKCYECFNVTEGLLTPFPSNKTIVFDRLHSQFMNCVNVTNDTFICPSCMEDYLKLNDYYNSISNENEKIGVCMDIVDVMNTTRMFWSVKCCKSRQHSEYIFLGSTTLVILLTILFYIMVKLCNDRKRPTILQQNRFAGSLSHFHSTSE